YFPAERYRAPFAAEAYRQPGEEDLALGRTNYGLAIIPRYQAVDERRAPADYRARYDGEIRQVDDQLAAVAAMLKARGLWDRSLVILTADHGEGLGEHRYY